MGWIYLAESEESPSLSIPGFEPSRIANASDTHKAFYFQECAKVCFIERPSGMTCALSELTSWAVSTSLLEASPARTSALQEMESAWVASDPVCSSKLSDSLAIFDQDSFSWKTSQLSLFGGLTEFSWSSLRWGMTRAGQLSQPLKWEPHTLENVGSYLPTPLAEDCGSQNNNKKGAPKESLPQMARSGRWPTPRASDGEKGGPNQGQHGAPSLVAMALMWPTPRAHETGDYQRDRGVKGKERATLTGAAKSWPTPRARDWKDGLTPKPHGKLSPSVAVAGNGHAGFLNPHFVEVMMGYPIGWTSLDALATQWFGAKRGRHSPGYSTSKESPNGQN